MRARASLVPSCAIKLGHGRPGGEARLRLTKCMMNTHLGTRLGSGSLSV